jgi:hypothetical protein
MEEVKRLRNKVEGLMEYCINRNIELDKKIERLIVWIAIATGISLVSLLFSILIILN